MIDTSLNYDYVVRETMVVSMRDLLENEYLKPEKIRLFLPDAGKKFATDIGSLAYSKRKYTKSVNDTKDPIYLVIESSLLKNRVLFLKRFFEYITINGFRESSVMAAIGRIRAVLNYIDANGYSETFLSDPESTEFAYKKICMDFKHQINVGKLTPRQAEIFQVNMTLIINIHYDKQTANYISGNCIKFTGKVVKTAPREREELKYAYEIYKCIVEGLTDFLVNERSLPFLLKMPDYQTFIFPYSSHRITPYCYRPTDVYNHELGRLVTKDEYLEKRPDIRITDVIINLDRATKRLINSNNDPRAKCRRALASTAMQSFQMLFMMLTGAYASEISQLEFDGQLEFDKSLTNKSYRAIKFRAAGRIVQYDLAAGAVFLFKKYLQLRAWILDGCEHKFLFFGFKVRTWTPIRLDEAAIRSFQRKKIIGIFMPEDFQMLTARQFRKTKSLFLHEQKDISQEVVAQVLNHSLHTNEQHYMEVSPERAREEFSNFWEAAQEASRHISFSKNNKIDITDRPIAAGHCVDYLNPKSVVINPPIEPDCRQQYGCLFCTHYICHADDEEDVHKLFSLLYIVTGVLNATSDVDKANELLLTLSVRVRNILLQIKMKSESGAANVEKFSELVFRLGELTPYWENRLQRYESLGLIFIDKADRVVI